MLKWLEKNLSPISIKIFYVSFFSYCADNVSDFGNASNMEDRESQLNIVRYI